MGFYSLITVVKYQFTDIAYEYQDAKYLHSLQTQKRFIVGTKSAVYKLQL